MKTFQVKTQVCSQVDSVNGLAEIKGERALIVTDQMMVKLGTAAKIVTLLEQANIICQIFAEVEPDPSIETVIKGVYKADEFRPDLLVAIGGGSSIDTAKAINLAYKQLRTVQEQVTFNTLFIAIPTTSGTGSEVTAFSVITDKEKGIKFPLYSNDLLPDLAIIDPELVKTVPPVVTADTGMDALTQAIEAYVSTAASDFTNALAEKAIRVIFRYLVRAYRNGNDLAAREKLHNASCMAGIAFSNAFLGINHSMAHVLGAKFHLSHGRANAILLPYVIKYNSQNKSIREAKKYSDIALMLGMEFYSVHDGVNRLIEAINKLNQELNIPRNLQEAGIDENNFCNSIESMSEIALKDYCTQTNPRVPTAPEIADIFRQTFFG